MSNKNMVFAIIVGGALFGLLMFIKRNLGDTASIAFLFFLLGSVLTLICVSLGGQLNDQGQRAFIQGLAQLKTVMAPTIREAAKTEGYIDRMNIKAQYAARPEQTIDQEVSALFEQHQDLR